MNGTFFPSVDFCEAQALWDDPDLIEIPVQTIDEPRYLVIGTMDGKHWSGVTLPFSAHTFIFLMYNAASRTGKWNSSGAPISRERT